MPLAEVVATSTVDPLTKDPANGIAWSATRKPTRDLAPMPTNISCDIALSTAVSEQSAQRR